MSWQVTFMKTAQEWRTSKIETSLDTKATHLSLRSLHARGRCWIVDMEHQRVEHLHTMGVLFALCVPG